MYELIFIDYSMPEMDGVQVAQEIRKIHEQEGLRVPYMCCFTAYNLASFK